MEWFVYVFISAILLSIGHIISKKILIHEHALEFSVNRSLIMAFFALFLTPWIHFNLPWQLYLLLFFISIMLDAAVLFMNKSMRHGELSVVSPLTNISPIFLLTIAYFVLNEVPSTRQYFGVFLLMVGAYALEAGIGGKGFFGPIKEFLKSKIIHYMIFAMVIFSITATLDKLVIATYTNFLTYYFFIVIFRAVNYFIVEIYRFGFVDIKKDFRKDFKMLFSSGLFIFFANIAYFSAVAVPGAQISLIIPIKRTSSLFTTILGGKLFHEKNLLVKVLASIIMIWGAVFILL